MTIALKYNNINNNKNSYNNQNNITNDDEDNNASDSNKTNILKYMNCGCKWNFRAKVMGTSLFEIIRFESFGSTAH